MWHSGGVLLNNMPNLQIKEGTNTGEHSTNPKKGFIKSGSGECKQGTFKNTPFKHDNLAQGEINAHVL